MHKLRALFVAGFDPMATGGYGGQVAASTTLLGSDLARVFDLVPLSSTMKSLPPPPLPVRLAAALRRVAKFSSLLPSVDAVLVFSSDGLSVAEKGLMCLLARAAGRGVVVRFSSGNLPAQCEAHPTLARWLRAVLRSAHVIVSQGPFWTRYFEGYAEAAGKVSEIPNAVVLPSLSPRPPGPPRIGFVGWMQRHKGIFESLDAFQRILPAHPTARFVLAGGGADLEAFRGEVKRRGLEASVEVPGWVEHEETLRLIASLDLLVLASHYEGLPNVMLEAMAAGVPVVATRVGSIPDVLTDEAGVLVEVGDVDAIAGAFAALLADPERARQMGARGRAVIDARFRVERIWPRYAAALESAARAAGRAVAPVLEVS